MIYVSSLLGFDMIREIKISNFRCFKKITVPDCKNVNIIVGDNGTGKTALVEAIFLALSGSPQVALRIRQQRGLEGAFQGSTANFDQALWGGFFYSGDLSKAISIELSGDGPENRSLRMFKGAGENLIPLDSDSEGSARRNVTFEWKDVSGKVHSYTPRIKGKDLVMPDSEEELPDFFLYAASYYGSSQENADRFSELSKEGAHTAFLDTFKAVYKWIEDIGIETLGGVPVLHAKVKGLKRKIPLNDISGGINRAIAIQLAISSRRQSVVCVDEVENGIYYAHMESFVKALLKSATAYNCQMFLTTHSAEWLQAFIKASKDHQLSTALWRIEKDEQQPTIRQFTGQDLALGLEFGDEVR